MNDFPINICIPTKGNRLKQGISCPKYSNGISKVKCENCLFFTDRNGKSNIPESKKKFLRDMIFSTGDFDEE